MNIILLREGDAQARPLTLTTSRLIAGAITLFGLFPLLIGGFAFWLAGPTPVQGTAIPPDAPGQVRALARLSHHDLSALAQTVGRLRAQASRLDALAGRLGSVAGVGAGGAMLPAAWSTTMLAASPAGARWTVTGLQRLAGQLEANFARRAAQFAVLETILTAHRVLSRTTPGGWPVRGGWISSPFGPRPDPFTGRPGFHPGVDIAAPVGTPVRAMAAGIVIFAGGDGGFGRLVKIFDGHSEVTMYAHLSARYVHVGELVQKGQLLGRVGDTGYSTGPHLHFEVLLHGTPINPIGFLHMADRR